MITVLQTLRNRFFSHWFFLIFLALSSVQYFSGISLVPFHPDESTQIYMSTDGMELFINPIGLIVTDHQYLDQKQIYRLLDAPLTRYLIGISYLLTGNSPLKTDWNWSKSWVENQEAGALPSQQTLWIARMSSSLFFPATLILIYYLGCAIDGKLAGFSSAFILGTNALVQLHSRRAMAEGVLLFGVAGLLVILLLAPKKIWMAAIAAAFAVSAKYSAVGIIPACVVALFWDDKPSSPKTHASWVRVLTFMGFFLGVTLLLHPAFWFSPYKALGWAVHLRQDLISRQVFEIGKQSPDQILNTNINRLAILIANLYLTPPMISELGNYQEDLSNITAAYLANPLHQAFRNMIGAGFLLFLTIIGLLWSGAQVLRDSGDNKRRCALLIAGFLFETLILILFVSLPWQRYVIPLVPFTAVFSGIGVSSIIKTSPRVLSNGRLFPKSAS